MNQATKIFFCNLFSLCISSFSFSQSISTDPVIGSPFCPCDAVNVDFTSTGVFNLGNTYTAQLSDGFGSFAAPVDIGTLISNGNAGTIGGIIPCNTVAGNFYRIRVISDNPAVIGSDNGVDLIIQQTVVDSVTIAASQTTICVGQQIDFTATPYNGGSSPVYQWQVNGSNVGANSPLYSSTTLNNGDVVTCILTSNAACVTGSPDVSNQQIITVSANVPASVSVFASIITICTGGQVDFTATPTNGGVTPNYQWQINGGNVGANSPTYSSTTLNDGDVVTCIMTSSLPCATGSPATSNSVVITVNPVAAASVSIVANTTTICQGDQVDFTATPGNGGTFPSYQWQVNGGNVGTNLSTFSTTTLNNGDIVSCIMTSSNLCSTGNPATSNTIIITVNPSVTASVSITSTLPIICAGDPVDFTATPTNGGAAPTYQWQVNGTNTGTNSNLFGSSSLADGDVVTCIMTSSLSGCVLNSPDTSNSITITVTVGLVASVTITVDSLVICSGEPATFTALGVNGGNNPTYQWQLNGSNVGSNMSTYTSTTLGNGDVVTVIMTSNSNCATGSPATSNAITMTVTQTLTASISIFASTTFICSGDLVNFSANAVNGGSAPSYQWQINGVNVGTDLSTYSSSILSDGDIVTCILTSNETCISNAVVASNQITITVTPVTVASVIITANQTSFCIGELSVFTAVGQNGGAAPAYDWFLNGVSTGIVGTSYNGTFNDGDVVHCVLTSNQQCVLGSPAMSNSITIVIVPDLNVVATPDTVITCWNKPVTLSATGADTYSWSPDIHLSCTDCASPIADPSDTTVYIVTGTTGGCTGTDTAVVIIDCPPVFVPSAFSPNGDGVNEVFKVYSLPMNEFQFWVYDRWGELIYYSTDQDAGWDGTFKGKLCATGVYMWMLRAKDRDNRYISLSRTNTGDVTLFR